MTTAALAAKEAAKAKAAAIEAARQRAILDAKEKAQVNAAAATEPGEAPRVVVDAKAGVVRVGSTLVLDLPIVIIAGVALLVVVAVVARRI